MNDKKIKNIILDLDGTILDSANDIYNCVNFSLKKYGFAEVSFDFIQSTIGYGAKWLIEKNLEHSFELSPQKFTVESIFDKFFSEYMQYYEHYALTRSKLYDGILENLEKLHREGYNIFILTNKPHIITLATIECLDIGNLLVDIVGDGKYEYKKPSIEVWNILSKKHNLSKEDTIMVGDGTPDYEFAKVVGCHLCIVLYGITPKEKLIELNAKKYAQTFGEVVDYISSLG